jgi:hypothetical protein
MQIRDPSNQFAEIFQLKLSIMRKFVIIISAYFTIEIINHGIIPIALRALSADSKSYDKLATIIHGSFELVINVCLLFILRPRDWPMYFYMPIFDNIQT